MGVLEYLLYKDTGSTLSQGDQPFTPASAIYCWPVDPSMVDIIFKWGNSNFLWCNCPERIGLWAISNPDTQQLFLGALAPWRRFHLMQQVSTTFCIISGTTEVQASIISHSNHYSNIFTLLLPYSLQSIFHSISRIIILNLKSNCIIL